MECYAFFSSFLSINSAKYREYRNFTSQNDVLGTLGDMSAHLESQGRKVVEVTVPSGAKLAEKVTPVFQLLRPLTNNLHGLGRFMFFISFCHILGSQMHGKRLVSGGGRPAEYIVNNGSNSMWAHFFPESIRGSL